MAESRPRQVSLRDNQLCVYPEKYSRNKELKLVFSERTRELSNSGLVFVTDNFSVSANIPTDVQPDDVLFDVCLMVRGSPPTVLSVVMETHVDQQKAQFYNLTLARALVQAVRRFTDEQFSVVYGLITDTQLNSQETFRDALLLIKKKTSGLCVPGSLKLPDAKLKKIILALLSVISLTDSVKDPDNCLWFLTLEQFVILTENIDQRQVTVRTTPSSGGKVLMREVAKRLERSGPTLLVMESKEQIQMAREKSVCSYMMTKEEWTLAVSNKEDLPALTNMVTNCPDHDCINPHNITGRKWTFLFDSYEEHEIVEEQTNDIVDETDINTDTHKIMMVQPVETVAALRYELKQKSMEIEEMKDENQKLRETEEKLSRMLDSVSLGGLSLDSGQGSDVSSLASLGSLSLATSDCNVDRQGATGGQGGAQKLLKRVKKTLTFSRSRQDLGTLTEEGRKNVSIDPLRPIYVTPEGPLYVLTDRKNRNPVSLLCRQHEMDRDRVNTKYCYVTKDGQLVNSPPTGRSLQESWRFENYCGTCSTFPISLSTSPFSLLSTPSAPQYWETETAVRVKLIQKWWRYVLEVGVLEEDQLDSDWWVYYRPRSWCVKVGLCNKHKGCCTQVWNQGRHVKCVRGSLSDIPGTSQTLRYGVVIDTVRGRLGFVDVDRGVVLEKMDVELRQTVYPVFGVWTDQAAYTLQMRLVSGSDIQMTKDKQKLIYSCLT